MIIFSLVIYSHDAHNICMMDGWLSLTSIQLIKKHLSDPRADHGSIMKLIKTGNEGNP